MFSSIGLVRSNNIAILCFIEYITKSTFKVITAIKLGNMYCDPLSWSSGRSASIFQSFALSSKPTLDAVIVSFPFIPGRMIFFVD